ncbi:hypothetical protein WYH_02633 [Croceibacterium atlanticum]|uniref:Uncharacterized protein n=1 Tax=Croceibacterium atlanticum TaxID=1267766 RepID=A0A0F7KTC9_9SPHN|nr:hypothetical protein [Croceibacterium atlanticum]AKH43663.1 hypothetical protein WYH_02633 [Croceibacterium atlanticum]
MSHFLQNTAAAIAAALIVTATLLPLVSTPAAEAAMVAAPALA